ncbi:MAG: hypothetical protein QW638_00590 [Candidatus Bathyarchaeia archaeon]
MKAMPQLHDSAKFNQRLIKIFTFSVSFAALSMGLSFIPLLPQPIPLIISFIISFLILNNRREGMIIGSFLIGLGLIYHMSRINLILILGSTETKLLFLSILIVFFLFTPIIAKIYEDIIAISVGIIAASMLFFNQTYFFAIPLIIVFAGIYKKQRIWLTLSYYAVISIPIQIMQYIKYIYNEEYHTPPPLYVPLLEIFNDIQESMKKISINEISRVLEIIAGQFKSRTDSSLRFMINAISEYLNSFPGVIFFLIIMFSLVSITAYIISNSLKIIESMEITKKYSKFLEIFFSVITVTIITTLFYIFLIILQEPLSYMAEINIFNMMMGIIGTFITTIPISFINYEMKISTIIEKRSEIIRRKSEKFIENLKDFNELMRKISNNIPIKIDSLISEAASIKEKLVDILDNIEYGVYGLNELERKILAIDTEINDEVLNLYKKLNTLLNEYYRNESYEFNTLLDNYKKIGIEINDEIFINYKDDEEIEAKIEKIRMILNKEWKLTEKITGTYEKIYNILRNYYDPSLPEENSTLTIAKQKIQERQFPCVILEAIYISINNLETQYSKEITNTLNRLIELMGSTKKIYTNNEKSKILCNEINDRLIAIEKKVNNLKEILEENVFKITKIIEVNEIVNDYIKVYKEIFQIIYDEITLKENHIEKLAINEGIKFIKNDQVKDKIIYILEILRKLPIYNINETITNLEKFLMQVDECFEIIFNYNETEEILLNYEISESIMKKLLKEKGLIKINELPFKEEIARKYMEIYSEKHKKDVLYDSEKLIIYRRD